MKLDGQRGFIWVLMAVIWVMPRIARGLDPSKAITQYRQDVWTERDGLPQSAIQAITQTRDGYLWIGTRDGLARFDGVRFTVFETEEHPGLGANDIRALHEDRNGDLWIGTFNRGVSRYREGQFTNFSALEGLLSHGVLSIAEDSDGRLWMGTWRGLVRHAGGRFDEGIAGGLEGVSVSSVAEDRKGVLWVGTSRGLSRVVGERIESVTLGDGAVRPVIRKVFVEESGAVWVGSTGGGAARIDENGTCYLRASDGLANDHVRTVMEDGSRNVWIGTLSGLSRYYEGKLTSYGVREGLPHACVETLYEDREGSLWVGTRGGGLVRLRDGNFTVHTTKEGLVNNLAKCVFESRDGALWVGSSAGGLTRFQSGVATTFTEEDGLASELVRSIGEDQLGNLWVGTGRPAALCRFVDGRFVSLGANEGLPIENGVRAIYGDKKGNLWVGGDGGGLCRYQDGKFTVYTEKDGLLSPLIRVIQEDRKGDLWIGTENGLCRLRDGRMEGFTVADGLAHNAVYAIHEDSAGTLWLGTQAGLTRYGQGQFRSYTKKHGLVSTVIFQVLEDDEERLWLSSTRGILRVAKSDFDAVDEGRAGQLRCTHYGASDGMKTPQCEGGTQPAGWRSRDGRLWFPTANGLASIHPKAVRLNEQPPPVVIERVTAGREALDVRGLARLAPGAKEFRFEYTALSFLAPEKVRFKYRLEGLDGEWVDAQTRRFAIYNEIPPGKYKFRVIACNNDGIWNEPGAVFAFVLPPRFYQTGWFYGICGLAVAGAGWSFHRLRMRRAQAQFSMVLAERNRIARELHDTLAQGFAGIAFQLEAVVTKLKEAPGQAQEHLDLALTMVRHSLGEARRSVMNLRSAALENNDLAGALSETARQMLADRPVEIDVRTSGEARSLPARVENNLLRIGQEAITNALRHASAAKVRVELNYLDQQFVLRVTDDGRGFEGANGVGGGGFGLLGMRERATQMGGQIEIKSVPGAGTEIFLRVPIHDEQ